MEFVVNFDKDGLHNFETVFDLTSEEKGADAYEQDTIPGATSKKIGTQDSKIDIVGGFKGTFGSNAPKLPSSSGWTNLITVIEGLIE